MVSTQVLVRDNSTLANFKQWAKAISDFMTSAGWTKSSDTGQVDWTAIASVPTAGNFVYEIWQPGDALTTFYLKIEYGTNTASTNTGSQIRLTIGTSTNGSGTLSGFVTSQQSYPQTAQTVTSTSAQWQCHFSGDASRIGIMMWRDETLVAAPVFFGVQRSLDSSGNPNALYVTLLSCGAGNGGATSQQSVVFGTGVAPAFSLNSTSNSRGFAVLKSNFQTSDMFNGNVPACPVTPYIGTYSEPCLDIVVVGGKDDFSEGVVYQFTADNSPHGVARAYIASKNSSQFVGAGGGGNQVACLLMRYD
jgi:hypothetical protein